MQHLQRVSTGMSTQVLQFTLLTLMLFHPCTSSFISAQKKIFWRMLVTIQLLLDNDFYNMKKYYVSQWLP